MSEADLADLDAFMAVVGAGGFRTAARRRGVSPSALSDALRRLEARLGVRLLNRTTRSVTPTEAGLRLAERLTPVLGEITAALDAINDLRDSPVGTLRLNVPTAVAKLVLPAIVPRFLAANPGVILEVSADDSFIDVLAAGFDAGIRYDERLERDMIAVPIGPRTQRFAVAAAPAYLARHGTPTHPRQLVEHAAVRHRFASGTIHPWEFEKDGEVLRVLPRGRLISNAQELEIQAAVDGLGLIATFEGLIAPQLRAGTLVRLLSDWLPPFSGPFLYYPSRRHMPGPLRAFVDFVKREARG